MVALLEMMAEKVHDLVLRLVHLLGDMAMI
jgi:hypothetical protein